jgi:hypothetical protein
MKYQELKDYYLCGIGTNGDVQKFQVGKYNKDRESFFLPNGGYSDTELYKKPEGSNATYVISAICLQEIDDAELLYKYLNNV